MVEEIIEIKAIRQTKKIKKKRLSFVLYGQHKISEFEICRLKSSSTEALYLAGIESLPMVLHALRGFHNHCLQRK
jgi:hypothetical protein